MNANTYFPGKLSHRGFLMATLAVILLVGVSSGAWAGEPAWRDNPDRKNQGEVQFTLTPKGLANGKFRIDVYVTTHSGELGALNLMELAELQTGGKTYRPVSAAPMRGHHSPGRLEFSLDRVPDTFEIVIRGVRNMGDLTFRWP